MAKGLSNPALLVSAITVETAYWFRSAFSTVGLAPYMDLNHLHFMASVLDGFQQ